MSTLLKKPTSNVDLSQEGRFKKYNLTENPFPSQAILNKDSSEKKSNGSIYEPEIRTVEFQKISTNFLSVAQNDLNHLRLGFILDSSYIGRGNGKTAFVLNALKTINEEYCLNISNNLNKCFGIYFQPIPGGRTKTFDDFVDLFFQAIVDSGIIKYSLASLRLEALHSANLNTEVVTSSGNEDEIVEILNSETWWEKDVRDLFNATKYELFKTLFNNQYLKLINPNFPLFRDSKLFQTGITNESSFVEYYFSLKKGKDRYNFIFTDLIYFFLAAGFNGAYIFVDDFERIPDHQNGLQKKDFASLLRSILYDGNYLNPRIGFFNFIFSLHAGVPRILQEAWGESGMEQRVAINPTLESKHMIMFEKINEKHAVLLIEKYLSEYRIDCSSDKTSIFPFTTEAIHLIALNSELNAAKILQNSFNIIETAIQKDIEIIDESFIAELMITKGNKVLDQQDATSISNTDSIDLISKAQE